ncbi:HlyD family efflux transporter periplasmic adaptor subunit [Synechococcus sp. C9]|uniref:HlyD family secretion protein n=1 Tax=Synechococcus sp. C9 TaxID=102119 RepID=UPI001FF14596|nr:HlyD family efflux transporter periplasmic adaptor subunit [Synechococcus sp. C9]
MPPTLFQNKPQETAVENNLRRKFFRWFRILFGAGLMIFAGYLFWQRQTRVISRVGYINAELITIYAPITGTLHLERINVGSVLPKGFLIGSITNERNPQIAIDVENLNSRLRLTQNQLKSVNERLNARQRLADFLTKKTQSQISLDIDFFRANVERARSELKQAQANLELARKEAQRFTRLAEEGAVSQQRADQALAEMKAASALVASRQAEVDRSLSALTAIQQGLQLDSARTFSFPQIRLLDLQQEITDLIQEKRQLEVSVLTLEQELRKAQLQLNLQRSAKLESPVRAVVWSVNIRTGELGVPVNTGTAILQLLDCHEVWATALVSERANRKLRLGQPAEVRLLDGSNRIYRGWVRSIRGGVGRITAGADVAVPPDEFVRNELEVQVTLDDHGEALAGGRFCSVGQSVEVIFP